MYDPTPPTTWFGRARYTPARDALRGELSARLDPRTLIAAATLPEPLPALVYTIVRRTRLWRREKLDVTRELLSHFAEGLDAGRTAEQLATDFGPADQAARLIRRGKIRNRPLPWHAARFTLRALVGATAAFVVVYSLMMARFYFSVPAINRNYWIETNEARAAVPGDAAWPLYREALTKLGPYSDKDLNSRVKFNWIDEGPTGKHWHDLVAIVERRQDAIHLVREGAQKPRLGYLFGNAADNQYFREQGADWLVRGTSQTVDENVPLISGNLIGPQEMRELGRLLAADAAVAAHANDGTRVVEDFTALLAMSEQMWQPRSFLVEQMVALAIFGQTLVRVSQFRPPERPCFPGGRGLFGYLGRRVPMRKLVRGGCIVARCPA
ncbi:MAG TPA: hypothetical protein VHD36_22065, partial [Pirellulales bacterium]|nr:hypothetical protein [Pirellulales bacterium]